MNDVEKVRFDYAWKWFSFHAEQRTKMFNFMLIGLGIFATGVASAIEKHFRLEAAVLASAAALIAIGFRLLDRRNRQLYQVGLDVLIDLEQRRLFVGQEGIASGTVHKPKSLVCEVYEGRHGRLMPLVTWIFVALFVAGAVWSFSEWRRWGNRDDGTGASAACCQPIVVLPASAAASAALSSDGPGADTVAIDGTGQLEGRRWWLMLAGLAVLAAGMAALVSGRRVAGGVGVAAGAVLSAASAFSLPLKAEFHFDPKIDAKLAEHVDVRVDRLLEIARRSQPSVLARARFGGFGDGVERFDCLDAANHDAIGSVNQGIAMGRERGQQLMVLLVGGTDRRPLSPALRRRFESNTGLARARVAEVERCLDLTVSGDRRVPEVIRLVTGPSYTPIERPADEVERQRMANDREVQAFVIGVPVRP
ncbi:MAG TPA: hypothetical protein VGI48_10105 [Caldimonas sp.]